MQHPKHNAKCRRSIPTSVQSASNPERVICPLCFPRRPLASCPTFPRGGMKGRKSPVVATPCRSSPRKKSSARVAIILPAPCSRFFWIASRSPAPSLRRPRPFLPRACINHETPRGYYRGNAKRPSFWSLLHPFFFSFPLRHSESAPNRNATFLATSFFLHHVLHHVNDSTQLSEDTRNARGIQQTPFRELR